MFLDLLGLGGDDLGGSGGGFQRPGHTAAPQTCPWSCLVAMMVQMLWICQSSQTSYLHPLHRYLPRSCENSLGSFLDDVGPRVDDQLQLGVLLPVLTVSIQSSSFTVSTSMFPKEVDNLCQFWRLG